MDDEIKLEEVKPKEIEKVSEVSVEERLHALMDSYTCPLTLGCNNKYGMFPPQQCRRSCMARKLYLQARPVPYAKCLVYDIERYL